MKAIVTFATMLALLASIATAQAIPHPAYSDPTAAHDDGDRTSGPNRPTRIPGSIVIA
jgi:hypothetical protein